ncbi:MAG TPA: hypothetical protein VFQ78_14645 [Candidatus Udaeobacter sp.]|nr:hypothetical protein [Candidatus Udaeobacter sp.]
MERTPFLKNYRIRLKYDGSPYEANRDGPTISYEAVDERTAEPVFVTLIPVNSIDHSERDRFEEHVSAAQKLRHVNIANILDFGREGDDYVYISERLPGETLTSWINTHGPMAADAALRVGEQIVSVLSSAGFHKLPYPSIQPNDIVLVPGQTAEGNWPLVKITNFGLPALVANAEPPLSQLNVDEQPIAAAKTADDQQLSQPTKDLSSEVYSLGVTLYFLLTGEANSPKALQEGPNLSGFPKPLRSLLGRMTHRDADQRPKDFLVVTEMIRRCLGKIERRRQLSDRYGIPIRTTIPRRTEPRPRRLVRTAVPVFALLLLAAVIAPFVFPNSLGKMIRGSHIAKPVGVLIGVPDSSPAALAQAAQSATARTSGAVISQSVNPLALSGSAAGANTTTTANPPVVASTDIQQFQTKNAPSQGSASTDSGPNSGEATPDSSASADTDAKSTAQAKAASQATAETKSSSRTPKKSLTSNSRRASEGRNRSTRSRVVGITADGRLILRLPSGRTAIVAPDEDGFAPRHRRRVIDRDQMFGNPPGFEPDFPFD